MIEESLDDVLKRLDQVDQLLDALDLREVGRRSRFAEYRRRIEQTRHLFAGVGGDGRRRAEERFLAEGLTGYSIALTESDELADVVPYLETCDKTVIRQKVNDILAGPPLPLAESATSNHARNTLFDLNVGARLWRAGLKPELGRGTDVRCEVGEAIILIECKRPFAATGVGPNVKKARHQILHALKREPAGSRGVIAISLSRMVSQGDKYIIAASQAVATRALREDLLRVASSSQHIWTSLGSKIVGVLFHAIMLVQLIDRGIYATAQVTNAQSLAQEGSRNWATFRELSHGLGTANDRCVSNVLFQIRKGRAEWRKKLLSSCGR